MTEFSSDVLICIHLILLEGLLFLQPHLHCAQHRPTCNVDIIAPLISEGTVSSRAQTRDKLYSLRSHPPVQVCLSLFAFLCHVLADLHVWNISSKKRAVTVHVVVTPGQEKTVLRAALQVCLCAAREFAFLICQFVIFAPANHSPVLASAEAAHIL